MVRAAVLLGVILLSGCIEWVTPLRTDVTTPFGSDVVPEILVVGDFDGDGFEDLAGYGWQQSLRSGYVLWSDGDGTFTQGVLPGGRWPEVAGDFDGDGTLDLVRTQTVFTYYQRINPLLNDGTASFTEDPSLGVDSGPLNAGGGGYVRLRRGGRDVLFGNLFSLSPFAGLGSPRAIGDIDGDGDDDVAVVADGELVFFQWTGSAWAPFPPYQELPVTVAGPFAGPFVRLVDLDGDEITDLA